jgi:tRNA pseudouridine55 synthase
MNKEKEYVVIIKLGEKRDTDDITGRVLTKKRVLNLRESTIKSSLDKFIGEIEQVPPLYSALKVKGVPMYKLAREGKSVIPKARKIRIYEIKYLHYIPPLLGLKVVCSKGTYIRALARDLGDVLGCGGCVKSLVRTRIGEYRISQTVNPKSITTVVKLQNLLINAIN